MIDKIKTADEAVAVIPDGASIMVGGFMACGTRRFSSMLL